jgi:NAD(P)-dependent dehydrogenase (short-subunit alcohol dehydrogenase family)
MVDLNSRVALVTGGSRGIGRAVALALTSAGAAVAVNYRERARQAEAVVEAIRAMGRLAIAVGADVSLRGQVMDMIAQVERELGPVDVLINNAGIAIASGQDDLSEEDFDRTIAVNLKAAFSVLKRCSQACAPAIGGESSTSHPAIAEANADLPAAQRMVFRMGINDGDIMVKDDDIFGDGVNVAARLEALADPGGICVSRGVRDAVRQLGAFRFEDLGEQQVKNIARPVRACRRMPPEAEPDPQAATPVADPVESLAVAGPTDSDVDIAFWGSVRDSESVEELLRYLERFPEGQFAAPARDRIATLSQETAHPDTAVGADTAVELAFWESIKDSTNAALFSAYLERFPEGNFATLAHAKLEEISHE